MTVLKVLLTSLIIMPFVISTASAVNDSRTLEHAKVVTNKSALTAKPLSDQQETSEKRVFNSAQVTHSQMVMTDTFEALPYVFHNEVSSEECYTRFGNPPVIHTLGATFSIDCNYYLIDE